MKRAGVLAHISSLPGKYGIGTLGKCAYNFIDFLSKAGFSAWQMLPINPIGAGFSPYQSPASMLGNPLFIDPDILISKKLISKAPSIIDGEFVDYEKVTAEWNSMLATFNSSDIQTEFDCEWQDMKAYAHSKGIELIGDLPIYVAPNSLEVKMHPEYFSKDEVSGCPPDAFSENGQKWNNPTYNWDAIANAGFSFWIERVENALLYFDRIRLDHFRGFSAFWSIPKDAPNASFGVWKKGPGVKLFNALKNHFGSLPFIAEDLGYITDDVVALKNEFNLPGMAVLQFAFDSENSPYLPENISENSVCYTGTHDNNTTLGWIREKSPSVLRAYDYFGADDEFSLLDAFVSACLNSKAELAILPIQDILAQDAKYRMNIPGTVSGNWRYRIPDDILTEDLALKLSFKIFRAKRKSD